MSFACAGRAAQRELASRIRRAGFTYKFARILVAEPIRAVGGSRGRMNRPRDTL